MKIDEKYGGNRKNKRTTWKIIEIPRKPYYLATREIVYLATRGYVHMHSAGVHLDNLFASRTRV